jgi:cell division protein FtsW
LLAFTMIKGQTMGGTNASRWIYLFGFSFQPSALANVSLLIFLATRLAKHNGDWSFKTL